MPEPRRECGAAHPHDETVLCDLPADHPRYGNDHVAIDTTTGEPRKWPLDSRQEPIP